MVAVTFVDEIVHRGKADAAVLTKLMPWTIEVLLLPLKPFDYDFIYFIGSLFDNIICFHILILIKGRYSFTTNGPGYLTIIKNIQTDRCQCNKIYSCNYFFLYSNTSIIFVAEIEVVT